MNSLHKRLYLSSHFFPPPLLFCYLFSDSAGWGGLDAQNLYAHKKQYQMWSQHHIKRDVCLKYSLDKNEHDEIFQHMAHQLSGRTVHALNL